MRISLLSFAALPLAVRGFNIILTNAEGWATSNIRATYNALTSHNNSVVISAPVQDKSQSSGYDSTSNAPPNHSFTCHGQCGDGENHADIRWITGDQSGPARPLPRNGEYDTVPVDSPGIGFDPRFPRFSYVDAYPVDAMRYGVMNLSGHYFGAKPDVVISGPDSGGKSGFLDHH